MATKAIYKITILGWDKYNANLKRGHKCILLSTNFLSDAKVRSVSPVTRLLYLSCLLVAGESTQSQIEVTHESLVFQSGVKSGSLQSQLDQLVSLQLLAVEKTHTLLNRIEKNRIEKKGISTETQKASTAPPVSKTFSIDSYEEFRQKISETYFANWTQLYSDGYIDRELLKALSWLHANPKKNKKSIKGWVQFIGGWLERGWDKYQASIPGVRAINPPDRFDSIADRLILACRRFSSGDTGINEFMGSDWEWISRSGIMPSVRALKANDPWGRKQIISDLRGAYEQSLSIQTA